jgi:hypothetical protein
MRCVIFYLKKFFLLRLANYNKLWVFGENYKQENLIWKKNSNKKKYINNHYFLLLDYELKRRIKNCYKLKKTFSKNFFGKKNNLIKKHTIR